MPQQRCVPHAIVWQGDNPYQAWPPHLAQSYPSLNEHTVGYGPVWKNGIPEHLRERGYKSLYSLTDSEMESLSWPQESCHAGSRHPRGVAGTTRVPCCDGGGLLRS